MKRILMLAVMVAMVLGFSMRAHATLLNRGTDSLGNSLIYDTDLDITWYDYTSPKDTWQNQADWADALTVNFGGTIFDDWRLPFAVDDCYGTNCTDNEMHHLHYAELGNLGWPDGCTWGVDCGLINTGDFQNLISDDYWSSIVTSFDPTTYAWLFKFNSGQQDFDDQLGNNYAIAVRDGDVSAVPEPTTMLLLGSGLAGLWGVRKKFK